MALFYPQEKSRNLPCGTVTQCSERGAHPACSYYLVGGLVAIFYVPRNIGNFIIPIDELIFFRGVAQPPTRNDDYSSMIIWGFPKMEVAQNDLFMFGEILLEWMMTGGNRISGNLHFYD